MRNKHEGIRGGHLRETMPGRLDPLYSEGERKLGSRACNTSFRLSDWSLILWNNSFKGKLWLSLEHVSHFILVMQMKAESPPPRFTPNVGRSPLPVGIYPGPWLHVFCSSRLWVWFLWGKGFSWLLKKTSELCIWHERRFTTECQMKGKRQLRNYI